MIFSVPLSRGTDYYCKKIDDHIKEDFETKIPDYGAEAFYPIGFHFKRKGNAVSGIYRSKHAKVGGNAFVAQSTHMHFKGRMTENKRGEKVFRYILFPQITQLFMLLLSLVFIILFSMNFAHTYVYVAFFAVVFLFSLIQTVRLSILVKRKFREFFE